MIAHWKDLSEEYNEKDDFRLKIARGITRFPKKRRLGPQNGFGSLGLENY